MPSKSSKSKPEIPPSYGGFIAYLRLEITFAAFYAMWNRKLNKRHTNIWIFLEELRKHQQQIDLDAQHAEECLNPKRRKKWRRLEHQINNL